MRRIVGLIIATFAGVALLNYQSYILFMILFMAWGAHGEMIPWEYIRSYGIGAIAGALVGWMFWSEKAHKLEASGRIVDEKPAWLTLVILLLGVVFYLAALRMDTSHWCRVLCATVILGHQMCVIILLCNEQFRQRDQQQPV